MDVESQIVVPDMRPKLPRGWFEATDPAGEPVAFDSRRVVLVSYPDENTSSWSPHTDGCVLIYVSGEDFVAVRESYDEVLKRIAQALES